MNKVSERVTWILFVFALAVLLLVAYAAFRTTSRYTENHTWLTHAHEVVTGISAIRSRVWAADAARLQYILSDDPAALAQFRDVTQEIPYAVINVQELTEDNPRQHQRAQDLRNMLDQHIGALVASTSLHSSSESRSDSEAQARLTATGQALQKQIFALLDEMRGDEESLLARRQILSQQSYVKVRMMLAAGFAAALILLTAMFQLTLRELRERRIAEAAVRSLSQRLLRVQDEERRKMAREIHDGLGQLLVALKFNLSEIAKGPERQRVENLLTESLSVVDQGVSEARTLSYLLHPPLLEELGFASAAQWFVDGFMQRSRIRINLNVPQDGARMTPDVELALFRVLQEALTNIHRHSGSASADIRLEKAENYAILTVQDYGKGIPAPRLMQFRRTGTGMGVGLAGMQERLRELNGKLEIESEGAGTLLRVTVPTANGGQPGAVNFDPPAERAVNDLAQTSDGEGPAKPPLVQATAFS